MPHASRAHWVSESTGSIIETQDALGHRHTATTRIYVQQVTVKEDRHSVSILNRLDV
jgi:site-specific recombinase XerC